MSSWTGNQCFIGSEMDPTFPLYECCTSVRRRFYGRLSYLLVHRKNWRLLLVALVRVLIRHAPISVVDAVCLADPNMMPRIQVDAGAIKYVFGGANIMCPGITSTGK